jgi:hypothetical protein
MLLAFVGVSYAGELEDLKAEQEKVVTAYNQNAESMRLLIEGFIATNTTYRALVKEQARLLGTVQKLNEKIRKLELPPVEPGAIDAGEFLDSDDEETK